MVPSVIVLLLSVNVRGWSSSFRPAAGAVTYKRIKVTDAERTEIMQKLTVYPVMEVV